MPTSFVVDVQVIEKEHSASLSLPLVLVLPVLGDDDGGMFRRAEGDGGGGRRRPMVEKATMMDERE